MQRALTHTQEQAAAQFLDEIETVNILCAHVAAVSNHHAMNYFILYKKVKEQRNI